MVKNLVTTLLNRDYPDFVSGDSLGFKVDKWEVRINKGYTRDKDTLYMEVYILKGDSYLYTQAIYEGNIANLLTYKYNVMKDRFVNELINTAVNMFAPSAETLEAVQESLLNDSVDNDD